MEVELLWSLSLHLAHTPFSKLLPAVLYTVVEKWMSDIVFWERLWVMTVLEQANVFRFCSPPTHCLSHHISVKCTSPHKDSLWIECRGGLAVYHKAYFCSIMNLTCVWCMLMFTLWMKYLFEWSKLFLFVLKWTWWCIATGVQKLETSWH